MVIYLCETTGCDTAAWAADTAGLGGASRDEISRAEGGTLATPPFLSPAAVACMLVSLDVTYTLRALSLRATAAASVEDSCHKQAYETTSNMTLKN